jgi:hypothetical protein
LLLSGLVGNPSVKEERFWTSQNDRTKQLTKDFKNKDTYIIKSPLPLFAKEGILPPFGKGSLPASGGAEGDQGLGGIFQIMSSYL